MAKTQYQRGIRKEYQTKKEYEDKGWTVIRASGSHGKYDLVCIDPDWDEIHLVQVKYLAKAPKKSPVMDFGLAMNVFVREIVRVYVKGDGFVEFRDEQD